MSRIRILVVKVDDDNPDAMSELASFDMPEADLDTLKPETALDDLEASTYEIGTAALKRVLQARWEEIDQQLADKARQSFPPPCQKADGHQNVKVASRFGTLVLSRQVLALQDSGHIMPGNALLPAHEGMIITRGLQEWACLLPQDLPFAPVARRLGWQSLDEALLCPTTLRNLVRLHGQTVRQAEADQVQALLTREDLRTLTPALVVVSGAPRRRAGWPKALCEAVDTALIAGAARPPEGERGLFVRREAAHRCVTDLRHLGPTLEPDQVLATVDEVLTRKPQKRCFWELRTARIVTPEGSRYLSGTGDSFLLLLSVFLQVCLGRHRRLLVLADGARWIRA